MPSTVQEIAHEPRHLVGLLEMRHVPGAVDQLDAGAGYPLCKLLRVGRCDQLIRIPPDDQGRRRNPVDALLEPLVRDRPDKLSGAGLRPDKVGLRLDPSRRIRGELEKPLRCGSGGVGKKSAPRRWSSGRIIQFLTGRSSRQRPSGSIRTSLSVRPGVTAAISQASIPPNE